MTYDPQGAFPSVRIHRLSADNQPATKAEIAVATPATDRHRVVAVAPGQPSDALSRNAVLAVPRKDRQIPLRPLHAAETPNRRSLAATVCRRRMGEEAGGLSCATFGNAAKPVMLSPRCVPGYTML